MTGEPRLVGARVPRICVIPDGDEHPRWNEVLELLDKLGISLDGWQLDVLHAAMLRRGDQWAAFTVAVCGPRQNGKNEILEARQFVGALLLREPLQIHTAHLADTCMESFLRMDERIDSNAWLAEQVSHVGRTNGRERVKFVSLDGETSGPRIRFRTRTRGGGRGFAGSPVYFDEPMFFPVISQNAILPVLSAQPDPQAWYTGSSVDQLEHEDGLVFAGVRERALAGDDPRLAYWEWSLDYESPDLVPADVAADPASWAATNPALGIRITPEYVEAERRELSTGGGRGFAVERLGVGDWPTLSAAGSAIDLDRWDKLVDRRSKVSSPVFAFDVSPDRSSSSVSALCARPKGGHLAELVAHGRGTAWVVPWLAARVPKYRPLAVGCDSLGQAASLVPSLAQAGVEVRLLSTSEFAAGCGLFFDAIEHGTIWHLRQQELRDAIEGATKKPLADRFKWMPIKGADITPLVSMSVALELWWLCQSSYRHPTAPMVAYG